MKNVILLVAGFMFVSLPAKAMNLEAAAQLLKLDNEQALALIPEEAAAASVVADLRNGKVVSAERVRSAGSWYSGMLEKIGTKKQRKCIVNQMMTPIDSDLETWAWKGGSADRYFEARMLSARIFRRLKSLLEFEAERDAEFLLVIQSHK